jgi:predicted 3-demethylubiquinone-9 3-methyltransferase (glyoxalase superfamily)
MQLRRVNMSKMTTCLWFDRGKAREAAEFYASVFPDSQVGESHASAADNPSAKAGEELTVEFTVLGSTDRLGGE